MKFAYTCYDKNGKERSGEVSASSATEASDMLRRDGLFVATIAEAGQQEKSGPKREKTERSTGSPKLLSAFARELALLVSSGTPLVDALMAIERQTMDEKWRGVVESVRVRVEEGASLAEALHEQRAHFDPVSRSMVAAGEAGGNLAEMLNRLAALSRQQMRVRNNLVGAMVYPTLLVSVSLTVLVSMVMFVLPRFAEMFETLDAPLPPTTALLMIVSEMSRAYWWIVLPAVLGAAFAVWSWLRTDSGRWAVSTGLLKAPQIGTIARNLATAKFARVLGVLLNSRVPMLEALKLTRASLTNPHYRALVENATEAVTVGDSISDAIGSSDLMTPSVVEAIRNGERTGRVGEVLCGLADHMDEDNEVLIRSLSSVIEPVILIVMGLVVAFVALSMFIPLFDLTGSAGGMAQ